MNIQQFVTVALVEIGSGVSDANAELQNRNVNSRANPPRDKNSSTYRANIHEIEFDIAVTAEQKSGKKGEGGLKVLSVGAQGEASSEKSHSTVSRIKFKIPMSLPESK